MVATPYPVHSPAASKKVHYVPAFLFYACVSCACGCVVVWVCLRVYVFIYVCGCISIHMYFSVISPK